MKQLNLHIILLCCAAVFSCKHSEPNAAIDTKVMSVSNKAVKTLQKNYETLNVQGKVKSITCSRYEQFVPDSELQLLVTKQNYKFDMQGNIIEEITFLQEKFQTREVFFYDRMGNCLKTHVFKEDGSLYYTDDIMLDEAGREISQKYWQADMSRISNRSYETFTDSLIVYIDVSKEKNAAGVQNTDTFKVRQELENHNVVKEIYNINNEGDRIKELRYDKNNNLVYRSENGVHLIYWKFGYDEKGRQTSWFVHNEFNNMTRQIQREYDEYGNITKVVSHVNGEFSNVESYNTIYVYDSHNNWIKRSRFRLNGSKVSTLERKIEYYQHE